MRLTKRTVEDLKPGQVDHFVWDSDFPGFGLKVTPKGRKVYVLQARLNGKSKRYTIGPHANPWSPDQARQEAQRMLGLVVSGTDPHQSKKDAKKDISIKELFEIYWLEGVAQKKPTTVSNEKGLALRHIYPLIGKMRLQQLKRHHIQKFVGDVEAGKTASKIKTKARGLAVVTGGKGSANRTLGLLSSVLSFAVERGLLVDNPAIGARKFTLMKHDRYLNAEELDRIGSAMKAVELAGASAFAIAAIRFLLLSGCRRGEALTLQWNWIDFDHNIAKLPDSKTGQKNLLLGAGAIEFLKTLQRVEGSPLVFPSALGGATPLSIQKVWDKVRQEAKLPELRLHDLRHNFASAAVSSGQSLYIVGKLLGHSQPQTTQRYAHLAPDPVRNAADDVASEIARKLG